MKTTQDNLLYFFFLTLLFLFALFFAKTVGFPSLDGENNTQFYADTRTYEKAYENGRDIDTFSVDENYFGPLVLLKLTNSDRYLNLLLNFIFFIVSISVLAKTFNFSKLRFVALLCLSPLFFSSLIFVNKEIISFVSLVFLLNHIKNQKLFPLFACIILAFLTRWQLVVFIALTVVYFSKLNIVRSRGYVPILILLASISIVYPLCLPIFSHLNQVAANGALENTGTGLYSWFIQIQNAGGYIIIFPFKALLLMFGMALKPGNMITHQNFYLDIVITLHSIVALIILGLALLKKSASKQLLLVVAILYLVFFTLSPIYATRYTLPVYILMCLILAEKPCTAYQLENLVEREITV